MESGIEDGDLRDAGHHLLAGADAGEVVGIVQGTQLAAFLDRRDDLFVDDDRAGELLPAVEHAVTDCRDFGKRLDHALLLGNEGVKDELDRLGVVRHLNFQLVLVSAVHFLGEVAAVDADAVAKPLRKYLFGLHVDELVFDGRASGVDD